MNKKIETVIGTVMRPLHKGRRAIIRTPNGCLCTTPVVIILQDTDSYVSFETKNTHYQVISVTVNECMKVRMPFAACA